MRRGNDRPEAVQRTLAAVPLLERLLPAQLARLARLATIRAYQANAIIVRQGDTSMAFYVVLSGRVRVQRDGAGGSVEVAELNPGGSFGEMGLIDDLPRAATVVALEPTECALLAKWDFEKELRDDPEIALALLPVLNRRIRELHARLASQHPGTEGSR
jgi:CRP/FNR family transcriptional regulator, cyclic AMP receptor protein